MAGARRAKQPILSNGARFMKLHFGLWFLMMFCASVVAGCHGNGTPNTPGSSWTAAPIQLNWRQAKTDPNGYVLMVKNNSDQTLSCRVVSKDTTISHGFTIEPGQEASLGLLQLGRSFKGRESGAIEVNGYRTTEFAAP